MLDLNGRKLILASASPRRAQLLKLIGLKFEVVESRLNEDEETFTFPENQVLELSRMKASVVAETAHEGVVVAADTVVAVGDKIFGKPKDAKDARKMLRQLSGRTHEVYTGFTILDTFTYATHNDFEKTEVTFREIDEDEIETYVKTEDPLDKAGAYGIQDQSAVFVTKINGCFYNVVGLPITKFYLRLRGFLHELESRN
ncbi:Maf family protein [bacterium]|nr:Maf family protein [bacterium]